MKKLFTVLFLLFSSIDLFAQVNGTVEEIDGKKVLTLWGTHQERGYAHGYLMGTEFKNLFDDYIVNCVCYGSSQIYNNMRMFFMNNYSIEDKYQTEADAMIQGMIESGVNLNNRILGRDVDASDILICTTLPDLSQTMTGMRALQLSCSSMSSWGSSTLQDALLSGHLVITRLMDWTNHPAFCQNHLLIVNIPSEGEEQKWISFAFAGFIGSLSGINESGVAAFMNVGNHTAYQVGNPFYPILLTVRNGIETDDYNQDMDNTPADVMQAVQDRNRSGASIIHVVKDEGINSSPLIIECNNVNGVSVRNMSNNTLVPGENLVATNHFRTLCSPQSCYRYSGIADSLNIGTEISPARSWSILKNAAGLLWNLHAIQYIESSNLVNWATSTVTSPAYLQDFTLFYLDDLFDYQTGFENRDRINQYPTFILMQNYPNPFNPNTTIDFSLARSEYVTLKIYNCIGKEVATLVSEKLLCGIHKYDWNASGLTSGIYFYRLRTNSFDQTKKLVLLK